MSIGKTLAGAAVLGLAGSLGYRWLRRPRQDTPGSGRASRGHYAQEPSSTIEERLAWQRAATEPSIRRDQSGNLTRRWDALFASEYGAGIPIAYLRALADAESGMDASSPKGLINVVSVALDDYNRRHRSRIGAEEMRVPATNLQVATDTLRTIIASYARHHPDIPNLREDWRNPAFVELLTLGWNAGFSEAAGVGKVVGYLKSKGQTAITADDVFRAAEAAGATRWLAVEPTASAKLRWSKGVARRYLSERQRDEDNRRMASASTQPTEGAHG